jgi:hypothetical protein
VSTIATKPTQSARQLDRRQRSLILAAGVYAATALYDVILRPPLSDHVTHAAVSTAFTALFLPFILATLWALTQLHSSQQQARGRLGTAGFRTAALGLILFIPSAIDSLATGNPDALGPLYLAAMLLSLVGIALLALALVRASVLPRWAALALPAAWLIGGPIGEGQTFRGAALILAATFLAAAATIAKRTHSQ